MDTVTIALLLIALTTVAGLIWIEGLAQVVDARNVPSHKPASMDEQQGNPPPTAAEPMPRGVESGTPWEAFGDTECGIHDLADGTQDIAESSRTSRRSDRAVQTQAWPGQLADEELLVVRS